MRVFVLCTGRCGSTTLVRAFDHATNYSAGHETNIRVLGDGRFDYPDDHVEADMRLSWFLGVLQDRYPDALYVHMTRDRQAVVRSYLARWERQAAGDRLSWRRPQQLAGAARRRWRGAETLYPKGIIRAFGNVVVERWGRPWTPDDRRLAVEMYVDTVNANIAQFLRDKDGFEFPLEEFERRFPVLWDRIGAQGDLATGLAEFSVRHNAEAFA